MEPEIIETIIPCGKSIEIIYRDDEGNIIRKDVQIEVSAQAMQGLSWQ